MKMSRYLFLATLLMITTTSGLRAQDADTEIVLTLDEAVQVALIQNLALRQRTIGRQRNPQPGGGGQQF